MQALSIYLIINNNNNNIDFYINGVILSLWTYLIELMPMNSWFLNYLFLLGQLFVFTTTSDAN